MRELSHDELSRYVLGFATSEEVEAIERRAARNPDVAAQISVLRGLTSESSSDAEPEFRRRMILRMPRQKWLRRMAVVLAVLWLTGGLSWASWKLLTPAPLLSDDFDGNWGDTRLWDTPRRTVRVEDGHVRIFDRGYLVTRDEFSGPIDLRFRWQWIDLSGDFRYRDVLIVALRSDGVGDRSDEGRHSGDKRPTPRARDR